MTLVRAINMRALMVHQGCDAALETLLVDMEAGIWTKLTSLYMTKSLANRLYLKKKLYTYYMSPSMKLGNHIDKFNKLILDLANIDIEIEDEDQALMLLTSLSSSYENFVETLLYRRESLTMEDVLATLNSRELKKRTKGIKEEAGDGLYVRGRSDHSGKAHSRGSSQFKSRGGTGKLKCFICHSEGHLKRDCPKKKSSGFVKKGGSYHMTHMRDFLYDFKVVDGGSVRLGDNKTCIIKGTWKVKIQLHDGSSFIPDDVRYVPGLRRSLISFAKVMTFDVQKHGDSKQVGFKQLGVKQGAQGNRGAEIFQVSNDDAAVTQRRLEDKQLKEKTNTDYLIKEQENVHLGIKVGVNIMLTGVPGQEGAEGNVAENKKVKESMELI
ncbi:zinc finger, CCHC-type containing protein [Tanacetum coccineum]